MDTEEHGFFDFLYFSVFIREIRKIRVLVFDLMTKSTTLTLICLALWLAGCNLPAAAITPMPSLPAPAISTALLPSATPTPATPEPAPSAISTPQAATRTHYELQLTLNMAAHTTSVDETITYINQTGQTLNEIVLAVQTRSRAGAFTLNSLSVDGNVTDAVEFKGQRMTISLERPLEIGQSIRLELQYSLAIPPNDRGHLFGYDERQTTLAEWYPFIAPYRDGWVLHEPTTVGENLVYESADFDVYLRFTDGGNSFTVAASAPETIDGEWRHYHLPGARGFHLSASNQFLKSSVEAGGVKVTSYYFDGHPFAGQRAAEMAAEAIQLFSQKFGLYPHESLSIVEIDTYDGLEGDTLFFLSSGYFETYDNSPQNWLTMLTVHETAHAWWYGLVGNDQALAPWLDEALCTYSERLYYENISADMLTWWWWFRVRQFEPSGYVDATIYEYGSFHTYTGAIYRRGAYFIEDLRFRVGDEAFFAFLKNYATQMGGKISTAEDFFSILQEHTNMDIADILQNYFKKY